MSKENNAVHQFVRDNVTKGKGPHFNKWLVVPPHLSLYNDEDAFTFAFPEFNTYLRTLNSQEDYKGLFKCVYGEGGWAVSVDISVDVGEFVSFPPLKFTAAAGATVKGARTSQLMLLVHRCFPKKLLKIGDQADAKPMLPWRTSNPVCLMAFQGRELEIGIKFRLEGGVGVGVPLYSVDGNGLAIDFAKAEVGVGITYKTYSFSENKPGWYPIGNDPTLLKDFYEIVSPDKRELKKQIKEWMVFLRKNVVNQLEQKSGKVQLKEWIELNELLKTSLLTKFGTTKRILPSISHPSTDDIIKHLDKVENYLKHIKNRLLILPDDRWKQIDEHFEKIKTHLRAAKEREKKLKDNNLKIPIKKGTAGHTEKDLEAHKKLCYATLTVMALNGGASFNFGLLFSMDKIAPNEDVEAGPDVEWGVSSGIAVDGNARFMSSRYQTYALSSKHKTPLVFTQDTSIAYTQVKLTGSMVANFEFSLIKKKEKEFVNKEADRTFLNSMDYYSVTAYWQKKSHRKIKLSGGSGISFGISISSSELYEIGKAIPPKGTVDEKLSKWIKKYKGYLVIGEKVFADFAKVFYEQFEASGVSKDFFDLHPVILMESSARFEEPQYFNLNDKGQLPNLVEYYINGNKGKFSRRRKKRVIETIRCRVRLDDSADYTSANFKLGINYGKTGIGVEINKIKRAGNENIVDVFTYDVEAKAPISGPDLHRANEYKVPPTLLMPHTFQVTD